MSLSKQNAVALLLEVNQDIDEYADAAVNNIFDEKKFDELIYPPNAGFTEAEMNELNKLIFNEQLKNAFRKIIADNTAGILFNLFNLLDGTGTPKIDTGWTGVKLVDEDDDSRSEKFNDTLHDAFFEMYWEWKKIRPEKNWKLDTLND